MNNTCIDCKHCKSFRNEMEQKVSHMCNKFCCTVARTDRCTEYKSRDEELIKWLKESVDSQKIRIPDGGICSVHEKEKKKPLTNAEKYKSYEERTKAFNKVCVSCDICPLSHLQNSLSTWCSFYWLEMEADDENLASTLHESSKADEPVKGLDKLEK